MASVCKQDKYYLQLENCNYIHKSPVKRIFNPIFRFLQFYTNNPFVIASITEFKNGKPNFIKYSFRRVELLEIPKFNAFMYLTVITIAITLMN